MVYKITSDGDAVNPDQRCIIMRFSKHKKIALRSNQHNIHFRP